MCVCDRFSLDMSLLLTHSILIEEGGTGVVDRLQVRILLLRSQLDAIISLSFKRDFENDHSKLRTLVDSRLENQRIWRFVLTSTITLQRN